MREQIQAYVNGLFADAALTIRNAEVRQEILQHTLDRYDDLVASGKPEQEAYDEAVAGIGDVFTPEQAYAKKDRRKHRSPRGTFPPRPPRRMRLRRRLKKRRNSPAGPSR